jgi:hypothetical protein
MSAFLFSMRHGAAVRYPCHFRHAAQGSRPVSRPSDGTPFAHPPEPIIDQ